MMKDKLLDETELKADLKCKLFQMIKNADGSFDDYSISPKIRQILLHCGYELVEDYLS